MNFLSNRKIGLGVLAVFVAVGALAQDIPLKNWTVPQSSPDSFRKAVDATPPRAFIGLPPCRILDTRGNAAPIQGGIYGDAESRNYTVTGICGIPVGADDVSVNFTVLGAPAAPPGAFLLAFPEGGVPPPTSILNYQTQPNPIANAAIVPLSAGGGMTVNVSHSVHIIMDVNGYFSDMQGSPANFFRLEGNVPFADAVMVADNSNTGGSAAGIIGRITSTSPGGASAGVRGINNGTGSFGIGGYFSHAGVGWGSYNAATGSGPSIFGSKGVYGQTFSSLDGSIGVHGEAPAISGRIFGVRGDSFSGAADTAGVLGVDNQGRAGAASGFRSAGVRGESNGDIGVLGLAGPGGLGTVGVLLNAGGASVGEGYLGFNSGGINYGVFSLSNYGGTGAKFFVEPHPERADMVIRYVALEGPESGTYFRGRGKFQNGLATIEVPEDFRMVTDPEGLSIQVTPIAQMATVAVMTIGLERIVVKGSRNVEFFYTVNGVRKTHKHLRPVGPGREYMPEGPEATMPLWLTEGQKQMLIANGTYKEDGTVNMETAKALGWDKVWEESTKPKEKAAAAPGGQTQE